MRGEGCGHREDRRRGCLVGAITRGVVVAHGRKLPGMAVGARHSGPEIASLWRRYAGVRASLGRQHVYASLPLGMNTVDRLFRDAMRLPEDQRFALAHRRENEIVAHRVDVNVLCVTNRFSCSGSGLAT